MNKKHWVVIAIAWLTFASLFFYGCANLVYLLPIILSSICFNFLIGNCLNNLQFKSNKSKKAFMIFGVTGNLLLLSYFKYIDFFIENINTIFHTNLTFLHVVLPLGISFFTFTQIAYLVDCYNGKTPKYNFLNYSLFVTFFPHLIAGPILHHSEMMPQFKDIKNKVLKYKNIVLGLFLFTIGLFKKVIIADTLSKYVAIGYNPDIQYLSSWEGWIVALSYTFQIYFDFSGYTDMALGSAKMFNINLPINFNSPYKAVSIQDFWRRWHITLSRFLRDYIYIPMGGSKTGEFKTYRNLFLTFLIGGLWHGASWMFVIWGALHGFAICINRLWKKLKLKISNKMSIFLTFMFVNIAWIFFRAENLEQANKILYAMRNISSFVLIKRTGFTLNFMGGHNNRYENLLLILPLAFILVFACNNSNEIISKIKLNSKKSAVLLAVIFAILFTVSVIKMISHPYSEFIYFNF
ncbi:MAG: MBOAT family protein [Candidatus Gastranaerophilales bacterium]|nr:MBOAT family protein [Candidatus Gastranaerophilales bacterium]